VVVFLGVALTICAMVMLAMRISSLDSFSVRRDHGSLLFSSAQRLCSMPDDPASETRGRIRTV
jgi:hypothetical protein